LEGSYLYWLKNTSGAISLGLSPPPEHAIPLPFENHQVYIPPGAIVELTYPDIHMNQRNNFRAQVDQEMVLDISCWPGDGLGLGDEVDTSSMGRPAFRVGAPKYSLALQDLSAGGMGLVVESETFKKKLPSSLKDKQLLLRLKMFNPEDLTTLDETLLALVSHEIQEPGRIQLGLTFLAHARSVRDGEAVVLFNASKRGVDKLHVWCSRSHIRQRREEKKKLEG
jgi:hypothetical protein